MSINEWVSENIVAIVAVIISLYVAFKNAHTNNDHIEIIVDSPVISNELYIRKGDNYEVSPHVKNFLYGNVLINNASNHGIGYYDFEILIDNKNYIPFNADCTKDEDSFAINKNNMRLDIASNPYTSDFVSERSQLNFTYMTHDDYFSIPENAQNITIRITFLKANLWSSMPILKCFVKKSKTFKFKYRIDKNPEMNERWILKKRKIKRLS